MKRILSFLLIAVIIVSVSAIHVFADSEYEGELISNNLIYFDTKSAGWKDFTTVYCHVWACDGSGEWPEWQSEAELCTYNEETGIAYYSLSKTGNTIGEGTKWACIFSNDTGIQTYNLLFGSECIGHKAYCDGTTYENPADSEKSTLAAFWDDFDFVKYGPQLAVTSIGNVVGTCCPDGTTPYDIFVAFLNDTLVNAQTFSGKDDQKLLDDIAKKLSLNADDVQTALFEAGVTTDWKKSESTVAVGDGIDLIYYADTLNWGSVNVVYLVNGQSYAYKTMNAEFENKDGNTVYSVEIPENASSVYFALGNDKRVTEESSSISDGIMFYPLEEKNESGEYYLAVGDPTVQRLILGDADGDDEVSVNDVSVIQRLLNENTPASFYESAADVDGDGSVSVLDSTLIQRYIIGYDTGYPIGQYIE